MKYILLASVVASLFIAPQQTTYEVIPIEPVPEEVVLPNALKRICSCESTGSPDNEPRHFDDQGNVLRGKVNPDDIGMCQINIDPELTDWLKISQQNGWDVFTEEGNKKMALWIYNTYGTRHWSWSRSCHGS